MINKLGRRCWWLWAAVCCTSSLNNNSAVADVSGGRLVADGEVEWLDLDDATEEGNHKKSQNKRRMEKLLRQAQPTNNPPPAQEQQQQEEEVTPDRKTQQQDQRERKAFDICTSNGNSFHGRDSAERLLLREGVIPNIPKSRCGNAGRKNVILAIGDGMGYEMARAGAIARQVLDELANLGCNTTVGCPTNEAAKAAFRGRNLSYYYTEGKGHGLSFQNLTGFSLATTSAVVIGEPLPGNHGAPADSLLGDVAKHENGMSPLALNNCGNPIDFNPLDISEGGNMVLWHDLKGGKYPWHEGYFGGEGLSNTSTLNDFDATYIMQHATDSAATATALATGVKVANKMISVNLYEEEVNTIVQEAMKCGMAGGVVSSVPILHATPAAFVAHSNDRKNSDQLRRSFRQVNPTLAIGTCAERLFPYESDLESMRHGPMSSMWTLFEPVTTAENFYDGIENLHPNKDHVVACLGNKKTTPYRGVDSSYSHRWCTRGIIETDPNATNPKLPVGVTPNSRICDIESPAGTDQIPHMTKTVKAALDFLSKDDQGMFLLYEQGDIDVAAHANHMDDMLGTLLDFEESVGVIMEFIAENGGWEKNALFVTADHDHYLTLLPHFPEVLANMIVAGNSFNITPGRYSNQNPWQLAVQADRHKNITPNMTQTDHIRDFSTWTDEDAANVGHFWGPRDAGGNGWGSHSTRPVPLYYQGDDGCIEAFLGKGYSVLGRDVQGAPGKVDQVHIHACMVKALFGY